MSVPDDPHLWTRVAPKDGATKALREIIDQEKASVAFKQTEASKTYLVKKGLKMLTLSLRQNQHQQPFTQANEIRQTYLYSNKGTFTHESSFIRKRQGQNILNAFHYAEWRGTPLNVYVVILLKDTIAQSSTTAFKKMVHKYTTWLAHKRKIGIVQCPPIYTFSHENPNNNPHVNWCLHIPAEVIGAFNLKLPRWIASVQGELAHDTLKNQTLLISGYMRVAKYIIKGLDPDCIDRFGLGHYYQTKGPQGLIYGHRAGFSRSLGPVAIKRDEFNPMLHYRRRWL